MAAVKPIPDGYPSLTPYLIVADGLRRKYLPPLGDGFPQQLRRQKTRRHVSQAFCFGGIGRPHAALFLGLCHVDIH